MNQEAQAIKLITIGDGEVGKTSILLTYTQDKFPTEYVPTIFENYSSLATVDNTQVQLSLWDTAGQESYNRLRVLSYQSANAFLIVFSVVVPASFENIWDKWIPELQSQGKESIPKIIIGNKCDLNSQNSQYYREKCEQQGLTYIECSAMMNKNIKMIFEETIRMALRDSAMKSICRSKMAQKQKQNNGICQLL